MYFITIGDAYHVEQINKISEKDNNKKIVKTKTNGGK